jgi:hypothetical protein
VSGTSSGGGTVNAAGSVTGGKGGDNIDITGGVAGAGSSVSLSDDVQGDTTGILNISQGATGGQGGHSVAGSGGVGGDAFSALTKAVDNPGQMLTLSSSAVGGNGGNGPTPGAGGSAEGHAEGFNRSGSVTITAQASAGGGGIRSLGSFGQSGNAQSFATGSSDGDFNHVIVLSNASAIGLAPLGITSGDAFAQARGTALGNSSVNVTAISGGRSAAAEAVGRSNGTQIVNVTASAGGFTNAFASATGSGLRVVNSEARANVKGIGGATAHAKASGAFGTATATSAGTNVQAFASAPVASTVEVETRTAVGTAPDPNLGAGLQAFAFLTTEPDEASVQKALAGNPNVRSNFAGTSTRVGLATVGAVYPLDGAGVKTFTSSFSQSIDLEILPDHQLTIGFINPQFIGTFDKLRLIITKGTDKTIYDFFTADEANRLLNDTLLDLGSVASTGLLNLGFEFDFTTASLGSSYTVEMLYGNLGFAPPVPSVPLPGTFGLLSLSLVILAAYRYRQR